MPFLPSPCSIHPGTSKPVIYRVLLNENGIAKRVPRGASELSQEKLQRCIYHMSFQYSTATKAVRLPPVIGYSKKAADSLMMYVNNLRGTRDWIPGVNNEPVLIQYLPPEGEDHDEQNNEEVDEREGFFMRREVSKWHDMLCTHVRAFDFARMQSTSVFLFSDCVACFTDFVNRINPCRCTIYRPTQTMNCHLRICASFSLALALLKRMEIGRFPFTTTLLRKSDGREGIRANR